MNIKAISWITIVTLLISGSSPFSLTAGAWEESELKLKLEDKIMEKATFAAGCFWHVEATFRNLKGVTATAVGYTGGKSVNPNYLEVCQDNTGHAEAVEISFDPKILSYEQILETFWNLHDPTQVNRQGPDIGSQYRSVIFYHSPEQEQAAKASKLKLERSGRFKRKIATEIVPATIFYRAEEYHQQYLEKRGMASCGI